MKTLKIREKNVILHTRNKTFLLLTKIKAKQHWNCIKFYKSINFYLIKMSLKLKLKDTFHYKQNFSENVLQT